ncbi:MAG: hypothetical protein V9F01_06090 [Chitinophagaceae bacterium]
MRNNVVEVARRDTKEKRVVSLDGIAQYVDVFAGQIFNKYMFE